MNLAAAVSVFATLITDPVSCDFSIDAARPPDLPGETVTVAHEGPMHRRFVSTLSTGEFLDVTYWACIHFGQRSTMIVPNRPDDHRRSDPFDVTAYIEPRLLELAGMAPHYDIRNKVQAALARNSYRGGSVRERIFDDFLVELYYQVEETEDYYVITVLYWFN
jgi:hypothetical protein